MFGPASPMKNPRRGDDSAIVASRERIMNGPRRSVPLILIADDRPYNRDLLTAFLEPEGYALAEAADGEEALRKVAEMLPDMVLLDIMMPRMHGIDVCRRLRAEYGDRGPRVVMVSALGDAEDVNDSMGAGADGYIIKPVDRANLLAVVSRWVGRPAVAA